MKPEEYKLRECQRCGGNVGLFDNGFRTAAEKKYYAGCYQCGYQSSRYDSVEEAIKAWNAENATTEESDVKCTKCGEKWRMTIKGNLCLCKKCGNEWSIAATMKMPKLTDEQLAEFEKSKNEGTISVINDYVRPVPCVRDEHGEIKEQTVKQLLSKVNEELDELKQIIAISESLPTKMLYPIAEEAADTITAITTLLEAMGIDAEMRNEAQRQVNAKNRERGRL